MHLSSQDPSFLSTFQLEIDVEGLPPLHAGSTMWVRKRLVSAILMAFNFAGKTQLMFSMCEVALVAKTAMSLQHACAGDTISAS